MIRHVTLKQFRLLAAASRSGSFAAAAAASHLTPPAVTMQMRELEAAAGLPLFERAGRKLNLTAAGREMLTAAERIEVVLADCAAGLAALQSLAGGRVTVGVVSTAKYVAPQMLAAFARGHPGIDIEIVIGNRNDTVTALKTGRLDVAIMGRPPQDVAVESALIGDHPQFLIGPPGHRLAGRSNIAPQEIAGETLLVREVGSGTRALAEAFLAQHRVKPRLGMEIASNETIKQSVMAGLGIAFISGHTMATEIADGRLVVLDVVGLPDLRQWFAVRLAAKRMMPPARALRDFLASEGKRFLPDFSDYLRKPGAIAEPKRKSVSVSARRHPTAATISR